MRLYGLFSSYTDIGSLSAGATGYVLKERDDLRQVIDYGSSGTASIPPTPTQWAAPLRYRFSRIVEEIHIACEWRIAAQWQVEPGAQQCLALIRVAEESLSNIIKHSRARHVQFEKTTSAKPARLC